MNTPEITFTTEVNGPIDQHGDNIKFAWFGGKYYTLNHADCVRKLVADVLQSHAAALRSHLPTAPQTVGEELRKAAEAVVQRYDIVRRWEGTMECRRIEDELEVEQLRTALSRSAVPAANFLQKLPGGNCFAHGPYTEMQCPKWPACATDPQKAEYLPPELQHMAGKSAAGANHPSSPAPAETVRREALEEAINVVAYWADSHRGETTFGQAGRVIIERLRSLQHSTAPEQGEGGRK